MQPFFLTIKSKFIYFSFFFNCEFVMTFLKVEKIFGPGNQYVTAAKMILQVSMFIFYIKISESISTIAFRTLNLSVFSDFLYFSKSSVEQ